MIISLVNQKGGVGKTTLSVCLAYESQLRGNKTLLVDADPQASVMSWTDNRDVNLPLPHNLHVISMAKKTLYRDLPALTDGYDVVIIDSPPKITDITISVIAASEFIIVPCTPSPYDIWSSEEILKEIIKYHSLNPKRQYAMLINIKRPNTDIAKLAKEAIVALCEKMEESIPVLKTEIYQRVVFQETAVSGLAVQEKDKELKASSEIKELYEEIQKQRNTEGRI